jgi:hypothetical protein
MSQVVTRRLLGQRGNGGNEFAGERGGGGVPALPGAAGAACGGPECPQHTTKQGVAVAPVARGEHAGQVRDGGGVGVLLAGAVRVGRDRQGDRGDAAAGGLGQRVAPGPRDQQVMAGVQAGQGYRPAGNPEPGPAAALLAGHRGVGAGHDQDGADGAFGGKRGEHVQHPFECLVGLGAQPGAPE